MYSYEYQQQDKRKKPLKATIAAITPIDEAARTARMMSNKQIIYRILQCVRASRGASRV